jgi:O-antigen/teichoic acid export membrane protein
MSTVKTIAPASAKRLPRIGRRLRTKGGSLSTVADQILSSGSNFLLTLCVAKTVSPHDVGVFAFVYGTYIAVLGCSRAAVSDVFLMAHTVSEDDERAEMATRGLMCAMYIGAIASLLCGVVAVALGGVWRAPLLCLAVALPALLGQDFLRYYFFVIRKPLSAVASDAVWVSSFLCAVIVSRLMTTNDSLYVLLLAWGAAGAAAGLIALPSSGLRLRPRLHMSWLSVNRRRWPPILLEYAVTGGTIQVAFFPVAFIAGVTALGHMRAAMVLIGPVTVLFQGSSAFVIPELIRRRSRSDGQALRLLALSATGLVIIAVACGLFFYVLPTEFGVKLLGDSWAPAHRLVPALTVFAVFEAVVVSMRSALRGWGIYHSGYRARLYMAPVVCIAVIAGAVLADDVGAQWGLALANLVGAAIWVSIFGRAAPSAVASLARWRRGSVLARSRRIAENPHGA